MTSFGMFFSRCIKSTIRSTSAPFIVHKSVVRRSLLVFPHALFVATNNLQRTTNNQQKKWESLPLRCLPGVDSTRGAHYSRQPAGRLVFQAKPVDGSNKWACSILKLTSTIDSCCFPAAFCERRLNKVFPSATACQPPCLKVTTHERPSGSTRNTSTASNPPPCRARPNPL